eukprot:CAMPEP_0195538502 /NCGR_PEP_ID=MMETSP0794_2-20130614/49562_1 /TAXON_ID=515487 /ORGANISM="Stephanopyxis turris, Strain CCMP 815" /LENGTH=169 /DNA_ID=CAMNT_0040672487 /DNA_START=283 /DNA_END=792 /DNA_ORIENTATION=-
MAFDLPIEADRPEGGSIISSLVRAPVIGFMWIFGGGAAQELEEADRCVRDDEDICSNALQDGDISSCKDNYPSVFESDVSEDGDSSSSVDTEKQNEENRETSSRLGNRRKGSISWSDESGQSLVEYQDEVQGSVHEPGTTIPIKSAIRRSSSDKVYVQNNYQILSRFSK